MFKKTTLFGGNFLCLGHRHTIASPLRIFTSYHFWPQVGGFAWEIPPFLRKVSVVSESTNWSATRFRFFSGPNEGCSLRQILITEAKFAHFDFLTFQSRLLRDHVLRHGFRMGPQPTFGTTLFNKYPALLQ